MKAMIFAAGLGTRLKPLTDTMPKALVPVGGQPLLGLLISKLKDTGYDDIVINVHHFADMVEEYVRSLDSNGLTISFSDERDLLRDTGGGLLHARKLLEGSGHFLIHNVDIVSNADLHPGTFTAKVPAIQCPETFPTEAAADPLVCLAVSERKATRYLLFSPEMRLVGRVNYKTGYVDSPFVPGGRAELDSPQVKNCPQLQNAIPLGFSGIHYVSDRIFPLLEEYASDNKTGGLQIRRNLWGTRNSWVAPNFRVAPEVFSITDFYLSICADQCIMGVIPENFRVVDAGKMEALKDAEALIGKQH